MNSYPQLHDASFIISEEYYLPRGLPKQVHYRFYEVLNKLSTQILYLYILRQKCDKLKYKE